MQLVFKKLSLRNFLSFGNNVQEIDLTSGNFRIITGKNLDKSESDEKNGVGKSSIILSIFFTIYGRSIGGKINLPQLVNNINKKNLETVLIFEKDNIEYRIERGRNPTYLRFYKNGIEFVDETQGDSRETQKEIERVIGMNENLFCQLVLITGFVPLFYNQPISTQKEIIEQILGVDIISEKINNLKNLIKDTKNDLNNELFKYNTIKKNNESIIQTINKQKENLEKLRNERKLKLETDMSKIVYQLSNLIKIDVDDELDKFKKLSEYNANVEHNRQLENSLNDLTIKLNVLNDACTKIEMDIQRLSKINFDEQKDILTYNENIKVEQEKYELERKHNLEQKNYQIKLETEFKNLTNQQKKWMKELENLQESKCPTCNQVIDKDKADDLKKSLTMHIEKIDDDIHKINVEIMEVIDSISNFQEREFCKKECLYTSLKELIDDELNLSNSYKKLDDINQSKKELQKDIDDIKSRIINVGEKPITYYHSLEDIMNHKATVEALKSSLLSLKEQEDIDAYKDQDLMIDEMKKNIQELDDSIIKECQKNIEHQELLLKLLSSPSSFIRKTILDKSLEFLNNRITHYLVQNGSSRMVQFNNDMTMTISSFGQEYGYISSGEMGRVELALLFAFIDVWETLNNCQINLLCMDEKLDKLGLDKVGVDLTIETLRSKKEKNILLVTHNDTLLNQCDECLVITKQGNFSTIQ